MNSLDIVNESIKNLEESIKVYKDNLKEMDPDNVVCEFLQVNCFSLEEQLNKQMTIKKDLEKHNYCLQFLRELFQVIEYNSGILYDHEEDIEEPIFQLKCKEHTMDITEELYFLLVNLEYKILKDKVGDNK